MSIRVVCVCLLAAVAPVASACGGGSAHEGSPCPRQVDGAAWVPAARELVATGKGRLVTVAILPPRLDRRARAMAVAVARAALAS